MMPSDNESALIKPKHFKQQHFAMADFIGKRLRGCSYKTKGSSLQAVTIGAINLS